MTPQYKTCVDATPVQQFLSLSSNSSHYDTICQFAQYNVGAHPQE